MESEAENGDENLGLGLAALHDITAQMMADQWYSLRAEIMDRPPSQGEIEGAAERGTVREHAYSGFASDIPTGVSEAIVWLRGHLAAVPKAHRPTAYLSIDSDDYSASLSIGYIRPETNKEWAARRADVARRQALAEAAQQERERAEFERLKAKFDHTI